ncbi:MAG: hypothetical protein HY698_07665 [Deltaproteobacteria bacterium]|nr:hypothetical protein [Deltaproteobacteria bacterium]
MDAKARLLKVVPNPQPHCPIEDAEETPAARRLHCRHYDDCLDAAIAGDWPGFSCQRCGAFVPLSPLSEERDLRGLLELSARALASNENKKE